MSLFAWTPFFEPLPFVQNSWLWLIVPLVLGISMMYKAIRVESMKGYWPSVGLMCVQVLLAFAGLAVGFFLLVQFIVPLLPAGS
jgi:hypothetical protein